MKRNRFWILAMTFVLLLTLVTGCASKSADGYLELPAESAPAAKDDYYVESELMDFGYENSMSADGKGDTQLEETESTVQSANAAKINRKIIWTVDLSVETLEFDQFLTQLDRAIADFGGYLESSSVSGTSINYSHNRDGYLTVRVPTGKLDEFLTQVGEMGTITHTGKTSEDITLDYVDVENRISSLKVEMEKLTELMEEADGLDAVIQLEARLSEVRYQLENYTSTRNRFDSLVDFSTVNIDLREVKRVTVVPEQTVGQRIAAGWSDTLYDLKTGIVDFFVWFVVNLPYILIWAVIITAAVILLRKVLRSRKEKRAARPVAMPPQAVPPMKKPEEK
ncbi:MAG: DUF4349 domain-containing protein [Oscillospiraceae bacterium]|nr:DUF4349 domain-containing protein [Oscillospiraceae bacterium]